MMHGGSLLRLSGRSLLRILLLSIKGSWYTLVQHDKKRLVFAQLKDLCGILAGFVICFVVLFFSQNWMLNTIREEKQEQSYAMLKLAKTTTDLSLDQAFKLSQLLLLDMIAPLKLHRQIL